jgi:hypothetical protein
MIFNPQRMKINCFIIPALIILLSAISVPSVTAQPIFKHAGLRTGYMGGIFFQATEQTGNAETGYLAMLSFRNNGVQFTGLRVIYETSLDEISSDLYLGWGYGGHAGFVVTDNLRFLGRDYYFRSERFCPLLGVDGWGTIEYRFRSVPLALSLNLKPYIELTIPSFIRIMPGDLGISISYTF